MFYVTRGTNVGVCGCFFLLKRDTESLSQEPEERMAYFKQAREFIFLAKKKQNTSIATLNCWKSHLLFRKTCLFQDGGGDDKQITENV